jgi:hypothetical protein
VLCGGFRFFGCIIFVSSLWFNFNKWPYASIDAEVGAVSFLEKKIIFLLCTFKDNTELVEIDLVVA